MKNSHVILIADDYEDDIFLLKQAFKRAQVPARLQVVRDGKEALAYLQGEGEFADRNTHPFPDLLLLDVNMPQMNGFEVLQWLRGQPRTKRLIVHVLTASSRESDVERAYELGANSYIVKPSRMEELVAMVSGLHQWHQFLAFPENREGRTATAQPDPHRPSSILLA